MKARNNNGLLFLDVLDDDDEGTYVVSYILFRSVMPIVIKDLLS